MKSRQPRRTSKAYAVTRARLSGTDFHMPTYQRLVAQYPTSQDAHDDNVYKRSHRIVGRSRYISHRFGRYFYCQHCGARITASDAVVICGDTRPGYVSCGNHGETIADTSRRRVKPGEFYR